MNNIKTDILLIIRGLLAVLVVIWHLGTLNGQVIPFFNTPGRTAVWFFFGISGYVIAYGFLAKRYPLNAAGIRSFYFNRFLRIYPLFLMISLLTIITSYWLTGDTLMRFSEIPSQLLMLQFNHAYQLNGVFWTLGIEVQFYILAPLLAFFFIGNKGKTGLLTAIAVYCLLVLWLPFAFYFLGWSFDGRNIISNLSHFFIGMIACKMALEKKLPVLNKYLLMILILAVVLFTNFLYSRSIRFYWTAGSVLIDTAIVLAIMLHSQFDEKEPLQNNSILNGFLLLGTISYGVYAWHPYLTEYIPYLQTHLFAAIGATVLVAYLSYRYAEKPILGLKKFVKDNG